MKKYVKEVDFFSSGFEFSIGKQFKKRTIFGGILSCIVMVIFIAYFIYLMQRYFQNQFIPKFTSTSLNLIERVEYEVEEDFFLFEVMIGSQTLGQYEKEVGKKFITYTMYYQYYDEGGEGHYQDLNIKDCQNDKFRGYLCLSKENLKDGISIMTDNTILIQSNIALEVQRCKDDPLCASVDEIDDLILNPLNYFQTYIKISQFNTTSQELEVSYKYQYFFFDIDLVTQGTYTVRKQQTQIVQGLVVQKTSEVNHLIGYDFTGTFLVQRKLKERLDIEPYAEIIVEISQDVVKASIQFPSFVEIITQFQSIVNILLGLGFIAKYIAQSHILKDVADIILKVYYKNTAIDLIKKQKSENSNQKVSDQNNNNLIQPENLKKLSEQVENQNFSSKISQYIGFGIINKLKMIFQNEFIRKDQQRESIVYENVLNEAMHQIDFYDTLSDILQIKKAIHLYLSPEQYAALSYCSSNIPIDIEQTNKLSFSSYLAKQNTLKSQIEKENNNRFNQKDNSKQSFKRNQIVPLQSQAENNNLKDCSKESIQQNQMVPLQTENDEIVAGKIQKNSQSKIEMNIIENDCKISINKVIEEFRSELQQEEKVPMNSFNNIINIVEDNAIKRNADQNHIIKLEGIDRYPELKDKYFEEFLHNYEKNKSQIDMRLYNSLYKAKND